MRSNDWKGLEHNRMIEGNVVEAYLQLIAIRARRDSADGNPPVLVLSSYFFQLWKEDKMQVLNRWNQSIDFSKLHYVICPAYTASDFQSESGHWGLIVVNVTERCITLYDSLAITPKQHMDMIQEYMEEAARYRSNQQHASHLTPWSQLIYPITQIPRQTDSTSCGVFICAMADCIVTNEELNCFEQRDIPQVRAAMLGILRSIYGSEYPDN
mmetsp:Transcript_2719/g.9109  ORF Transcript_2719/g.9109 Transcript_2719/m.9109 type:complete len:212 (-) Transcript_2719:32-667(-)